MSSKNEEINHGVRQVNHNLIKIDVSHGPSHLELHVPAHSTFGHVKKVIEQQTGLESEKQRILFRGNEKEDGQNLQEAGVRDNSKILVLEDAVRKEMREGEDTSTATMQENVEEVKGNDKEMLKAFRAIDETRKEIDKLAERVGALEVAVSGGTRVSEDEFGVFSELLMRQLLKLDAIEAEGEARVQRKAEVRRVQNFHEILDNLKARNPKQLGNSGNASMTTEWETFDSGSGSSSPPPSIPSSTRITQDWERLE